MGMIGSCVAGVLMALGGAAGVPGQAERPLTEPVPEIREGALGIEGVDTSAVQLRRMHLVRPDLIPYPTFRRVYA